MGATTFSITTFRITTINIITFSIMTLCLTVYKTRHNDTQHNAEHCYSECPVMLSVTYTPFMLSFVTLNVIMLNVVAPKNVPFYSWN